MRTRQPAVTFSLAVGLFTALLPANGQTNWNVTKEFQVGGEGGWDYLTVDSEGHRLFVPRSTHTMVIGSGSTFNYIFGGVDNLH